MTDTGVASLADALHTNNTLESLIIAPVTIRLSKKDSKDILYDNVTVAITENGLTCLVEAVSKHSGLKRLCIPGQLGEDKVRKTINEARKRNGLPNVGVFSDFVTMLRYAHLDKKGLL